MKPYVKPFLVSALIFSSVVALWDYFVNDQFNLFKLIFMALAFGALMSWRTMAAQKKKKINS